MTTPARYWRVYIRSVSTYNYGQLGLRSLRFFDAAGVDLSSALSDAQITTTFSQLNSTAYPLTNLVDGDTATAWVINWPSYRTTTNWYYVQFDFGDGNDVLPDFLEVYADNNDYNGNSIVAADSLDFLVDSSTDGITYMRQALSYRPLSGYNAAYRVPAVTVSTVWPFPDMINNGGSGGIYGIVSEDGVALPNRPVILFERDSFSKVGYTTTDENGGYAFNSLNQNKEFLVMSVDPSGPPYKNAIVWDRVTPINTLGNNLPLSSFWARRIRESSLGPVVSYSGYIDGATYNFFDNNVLGQSDRLYRTPDGYGIAAGLLPNQTVGGSLKFLTSNRTEGATGEGIAVWPGMGMFDPVNQAGSAGNYSALTFEYIFKAPTATESALIVVWSGTRDSDDFGFWVDNGWSGIGWAAGPTLEVTPAGALNVRFPLNGRNRSTIRATAAITPGDVYHVMITFAQDNELKLYVNGMLVATTSLAGSGRLWGHLYGTYNGNANYTDFQNWDVLHYSYHPNAAIRRLRMCTVAGYGRADASTHGGPGFGGAIAFVALYGRVFSDADVATFYDSFSNWDTHNVLPTKSGYLAEVEADNPRALFRLNDFAKPVRIANLIGPTDYEGTYEGAPGYGQTGFVAGGFAVDTSLGGLLLVRVDVGQTFSVEFFCRPLSVSGTQRLFLSRVYNSSAPVYLSMVSGALSLSVLDRAGTTTTFPFGATLAVGTDYHVVVTYDPYNEKKARLYLNGVLVTELPASVINASGTDWLGVGVNVSGTGPTYSERFQGVMGEFAIYQHILPAARVLAHYEARNA